ncbi:hypothetical protein [Candidatus Bathycorpusculum sp.]|jgi:hypothetical protein|uniref:hypothetical protein n=1 Tax=Candidatus Bathycorpusculum sp. TaxID=2994959 RepID=UPI0028286A5C|nr:hypothetical protein [Candidatus Termitimicrobium sp.]MCL2686154.1 hypothetical protein [Candidatus Termitimicrobium sp.]
MINTDELEGTTLNVYTILVHEGKPLGPRETMRLANLSSPSVAYWHLQKLETIGLISKNPYGEYYVKEKINVSGHLWVGKTLVPRLIFYAFFFIGILLVEVAVIAVPFFQSGQTPSLYLFYLMVPTAIAVVLFLSEGIWLRKKTVNNSIKKTSEKQPA